jgi:hypothetical protein
MSQEQTAQIVAFLVAEAPKTKTTGETITDPAYYSLGILQPAIDRALAAGKTPRQIASAIANMVHKEGWVRATGEFSDTELMDQLSLSTPGGQKGKGRPKMTDAEIKAEAGNGANVYEATARHAFFGVDGVVHRIEDKDYLTARTALLAAFPAVPDAPKPPETGGTPGTGLPGIG